jgi:hypothetical protein
MAASLSDRSENSIPLMATHIQALWSLGPIRERVWPSKSGDECAWRTRNPERGMHRRAERPCEYQEKDATPAPERLDHFA